jgi:hypothetical protein
MLLVIRAGDAIGTQNRAAIHLYADHHELTVFETQAGMACRRECELRVGPVMDFEDVLGAYCSQNSVACLTFRRGRILPQREIATRLMGHNLMILGYIANRAT